MDGALTSDDDIGSNPIGAGTGCNAQTSQASSMAGTLIRFMAGLGAGASEA